MQEILAWRSHVLVLLALLQLAACSNSNVDVATADREAAEAFLRADQAPLPVKPVSMWYATGQSGGMVCGEIEAPAALKSKQSTLRYVSDRNDGVQQIEMHKMWAASDPTGESILQANRNAFDNLWANYCEPYAPFSRRIAHWLKG